MLVGEERFHPRTFALASLVLTAGTSLVIGVTELGRLLAPGLPLLLYPLWFLVAMYVILTYITANDRKIVRMLATGGSEVALAMLLVSMLAATVLFGMLCKELCYGVGCGFSGHLRPDPWLWVGYGFDNLFEAVFLDITEIYQLSFTDIQPVGFWSQSLVFLFRTAANLLIIRALLRYWGFLASFLFARRLSA